MQNYSAPPLSQIVELNRRFVKGYEKFKDDPEIIALRKEILSYNQELRLMGIRDHQLKHANLSFGKVIALLIWRVLNLLVMAIFALPGSILFAPVFIATKRISRRKAKGMLSTEFLFTVLIR